MRITHLVSSFLVASVWLAGCGGSSDGSQPTGPNSPPAVTVTTTTLESGEIGISYTVTLQASGGTGSYTWSVSAGTLPPGVTLSGNALSGQPQEVGSFSFTVTVTSGDQSNSRVLSIAVLNQAAVITTTELPAAVLGVSYTAQLEATGGDGAFVWTIASGTLPAGLILQGASISGTPTTAGSFSVSLMVSSGGRTANASYQLEVQEAPTAGQITTESLPLLRLGEAFSVQLAADGGAESFQWSISGNVPPGVSLTGSVLAGTPILAGTFAFEIAAAKGGVSTMRSFALMVDNTDPSNLGDNFGAEEFIFIPGGTYIMGQRPVSLGSNRTPHEVTISTGFNLQRTEVTRAQWEAVMPPPPGGYPWANSLADFRCPTRRCPVERVSWEQAQAFVEALTRIDGNATYRLPTEAEWEYAARAGTSTDFFVPKENLLEYAIAFENSPSFTVTGGTATFYFSAEVATLKPNFWGLYDIIGNVQEWVWDWYQFNYYEESPSVDPQGPSSPNGPEQKITRGGSFNWRLNSSSFEHWFMSWNRDNRFVRGAKTFVGLRIVKEQ